MIGDSRQRPASRSPELADLDLHRIDLAARLLALKHPAHTPEGLICAAAGTCSGDAIDGDPVGVGPFIAEMVRHSDAGPGVLDSDRAMFAAERLAELLAALVEPGDLATLRALRRGGAREPLPLPSQRRIRRACLRLRRAPANSPTLEPLPGDLWDELLAGLARSLAFDREAELWADVAGDGLDEASLGRVRAQVRGAIARGARAPVPWSVSIVASRSVEAHPTGTWPPRERDLLPAGHRVGRFTLLQRLGVGAMGVVYSAVDPELDRRIAVKLLRAPSGPRAARAHARLLREAQAMARVTHPNVAVVHEVGTHDGDVFVAMELVRGVTLHAWLKHKPRTWREVVDVFMQAARGLAAAHAAGLVHRDFKPSNAMLGDDGRVRVLDFGLCFTGGPSEADGDATDATDALASRSGDLRITQREEIVGTPAYMPPEQFIRGGVAGPASDQFSFCASLYEGLYAQLPFAGQTVPEVTQAIALGQLRPPPRGTRVPNWLFAVLQRGLKPDPQLRFPTMDAMMRTLDRGRARARGSLALAAALALGTGVGGFWAARTQGSASDRCNGGLARIAEVWNPTQEAAAARAMAAAGPAFASEIWPRVNDELGRYAHDWQLAHRDACLAHRRGETSDTLLDRRMACLDQRRAALAEAVTVLAEPDAGVALHALAVVSRLPGLARCDDLVLLAAEVPPPTDPVVLAALAELRPGLARVQALEHAGLPHAAVRLADELVTAAESVPDRGLLAEALLTRGRLEINRLDRPSDQEAVLGRAFLTAFGGRQDELAA